MKKTLILSLILAPIFSFAALIPCAPGDKFDLFTGKACVTSPVNTINTSGVENYIASLIAQINALKAQIAALGGTYMPSVSTTTTLPSGGTGTTPSPVNASATVSVSSNQPTNSLKITDVNGQYVAAPILNFSISNVNGPVYIRGVKVDINSSGSGQVSAVYLYQGNTVISGATPVNGIATLSNINSISSATIPSNSNIPYTVKIDVANVNSGAINVSASINGSEQTIVDSNGNIVSVSGSASGNTVTISN